MLAHVAICVAAELVATGARLALALAVLLPSVPRAVVAVAIELDREPVLGPAAIHPVAAGHLVRHRQRKIVATEQVKEGTLEAALREADVAVQDAAQTSGARGIATPREGCLYMPGGRAVPDSGLMTGSGQGR